MSMESARRWYDLWSWYQTEWDYEIKMDVDATDEIKEANIEIYKISLEDE